MDGKYKPVGISWYMYMHYIHYTPLNSHVHIRAQLWRDNIVKEETALVGLFICAFFGTRCGTLFFLAYRSIALTLWGLNL